MGNLPGVGKRCRAPHPYRRLPIRVGVRMRP